MPSPSIGRSRFKGKQKKAVRIQWKELILKHTKITTQLLSQIVSTLNDSQNIRIHEENSDRSNSNRKTILCYILRNYFFRGLYIL